MDKERITENISSSSWDSARFLLEGDLQNPLRARYRVMLSGSPNVGELSNYNFFGYIETTRTEDPKDKGSIALYLPFLNEKELTNLFEHWRAGTWLGETEFNELNAQTLYHFMEKYHAGALAYANANSGIGFIDALNNLRNLASSSRVTIHMDRYNGESQPIKESASIVIAQQPSLYSRILQTNSPRAVQRVSSRLTRQTSPGAVSRFANSLRHDLLLSTQPITMDVFYPFVQQSFFAAR